MALGTALLSLGTSLAGPLMSYFGNKESQRKEHDQQMDMWNKTNEFNTPLNQRLRLMQGGYNPNLGVGSMQNTASNQNMPAHQKLDTTGITNAGTAFTNAFNSTMQTEGQFTKNMADADRITEQGALTKEQREQLQANKTTNLQIRKDQLAGVQLQNIRRGIENLQIPEAHKRAMLESAQRLTNLKSVLSTQQLQQELMREDLQLRKIGINPNDNMIFRILGKGYDYFFKDEVENAGKWLKSKQRQTPKF